MLTSAKNAGRRLFEVFGLEIYMSPPSLTPRASMSGRLRQLSDLDCAPQTVIDVGVAYQKREPYKVPRIVLMITVDGAGAQKNLHGPYVQEQGTFWKSCMFTTPQQRREQLAQAESEFDALNGPRLWAPWGLAR